MIKKLRRKFIWITMCSVILVLGGILCVINVVNYRSVLETTDLRLAVLAENDGTFPKPGKERDGRGFLPREMSPEAPFDTRFFTVLMGENGTAVSVDTGRIAAVSTEDAVEYAAGLSARGKVSGFLEDYRYLAVSRKGGTLYIFLDCSRELSTFRSFLWTSAAVGAFGILLVFVLVLLLSRQAVKPVAESYEKQKRFITDASHEIKTPLTIIDANTEVLEMERGADEWTASIKKQVARLTQLTEKLVFLTRMDEEGASLQMTDFSLSDAVLETAQPFQAVAQARGKRLELAVEEGISYHGDERSVRQLVSLLLDNALKYSNDGGDISLCLRAAGKNKELVVKNSVTGIEAGRQDALFERFYRPDASRNSGTGGSGIGLSVAKAIVTAHKGKISAWSGDGKSIQFKVLL